MNKSGPLDFGLQTRWEVERGSNFGDRQWEAIKGNRITLTDSVKPIHRFKRKGQPPWLRKRIKRAREQKRKAFMRYEDTQGCLGYAAERRDCLASNDSAKMLRRSR